jgi:hypothetical protein
VINQPSKEDGKRQVQNLTKAQFKISNTKQTRRRQEQRQHFKILHYHNKFWKATPAGYLIKVTNIHFSENPNKSASKRARVARSGDKIHKETNQKLNNIYVAISLGQRKPPSPRDRDSIKHQTQGTNAINQNNNYLSEPGEVTWQKTEGR